MRASLLAASQSRTLRTLALILYACLGPVELFTTRNPVMDADIWWHCRAGQWITSMRRFPHQGLFSQFGETHPWSAYSWGFEVLVGNVFARFGLLAIPVFFILVELLLAWVLFRVLRQLSGNFGAPGCWARRLCMRSAPLWSAGP